MKEMKIGFYINRYTLHLPNDAGYLIYHCVSDLTQDIIAKRTFYREEQINLQISSKARERLGDSGVNVLEGIINLHNELAQVSEEKNRD